MTNINITDELITAKLAAKKAGLILKNERNKLNLILSSTNKDIKLQADISSENFIKSILKNKSSYPILAEESGASNMDLDDIFWVVDPLDGTANYARDIPLCCVSIALMHKTSPIIGVIYDFDNDNLYEGHINGEAKLNELRIKVSDIESPNDGILLTGLPNNTDYSDSALLKMVKDFQEWRKVRMIGSAAIASCYIASAKADVYKEFGTYLWDVAAGAAIVNAAGGKAEITNYRDNYQVDVRLSNSKIID
jgi:myo-inositol-1(or 4)-monophosphatase